MSKLPDPVENDQTAIAESVRSGEHFRKARAMYDLSVHDLMTERYLYIVITVLSLLTFTVVCIAMDSLYPLSTPVPFIFRATDIVDETPNIHTLLEHDGEDPDVALLTFFVRNYVTMREEYDIDKLDRDANGVASQSAPAMASEFRHAIDPANPESPVALYQRTAKRTIAIVSSRLKPKYDEMEVTYEASVESSNGEVKKSRWQANITFNYSGLALDQSTGKVKPVSFVVTRYYTNRLQDAR